MTPPAKAVAVETTSRRGAVALVDEAGRVVAESSFAAGLNHTAGFLPMVADLLEEHAWRPADVGAVYVSIGPGGFTGTRVGVTFAKTFALATGARVVAVPTSRAVVENLPAEATRAAVVVDARRGKIWAERFERGGDGWRSLAAGGLTTMAELAASLPAGSWLVGEGVAYHQAALDGFRLHVADDPTPRVSAVAAVGAAMAREGRYADPFALAPAYVRRPEAEEKRLGLENNINPKSM